MDWNNFYSFVPFLTVDSGKVKPRWTRVAEALLIAAIAGIFSGYVATEKLEVKLIYLEKSITKLEVQLCDIQKELNNLYKEKR